MAKRGHRTLLDGILLAVTALFVLGGFMALGFLKNASQENRALLVVISSVGMVGGLAALSLVNMVWSRLRRWTWQRAMAGWHRRYQTGTVPKFIPSDTISDGELRQIAIQTYRRIGYRIARHEPAEMYLRLINPDGGFELVGCQQQPDPLTLPQVYPLELEMKRVKAVRGFVWAPAGFSEECIEWAAHRSIVLADRVEIGRVVDCAQTKGLRLLE